MRKLRRLDVRTWNWQPVMIAAAVLVIAALGWLAAWRFPTWYAEEDCRQRYQRAASHADTLRIDSEAGGHRKKSGPWNCGLLRKTGQL